MATLRQIIGSKKQDGTYPIIIQLIHLKERKYINLGIFVEGSQLTKKNKIKDQDVNDRIYETMREYRSKLLKITNLRDKSAQYLKDYLMRRAGDDEIDFIAFGEKFIKSQYKTTGSNTKTALMAFKRFVGKDVIYINNITLTTLKEFEAHLRTERLMTITPFGHCATVKRLPPMSDTGIKDYMGKLKQIFLAIHDEYSDPETGEPFVKHYPFARYKMPTPAVAKKRNVTPEIIRLIRDAPERTQRMAIARDMFMLSFYLVGINIIDLYKLTDYANGRISYLRSKTVSRKKEKAFISIKVEPEAEKIISRYKDRRKIRVLRLYKKYKNSEMLLLAINDGLQQIVEHYKKEGINIDKKITSYYARGAWSNIAWNDCGVPEDHIAFAFNHADPMFKVTNLYIEKSFAIVDVANRKVLDLLAHKENMLRAV